MVALPPWNTEITYKILEVFRISTIEHASSLSYGGGENRWNRDGEYVIYTGSSRALSTLELVVHRKSIQPERDYRMMILSIADDDHLYTQVQINELPLAWRTFFAYGHLQSIGSKWYQSRESLVLKVPSAVIPQEYNYVINTAHPDFLTKVKLIRTEDYFWDERLMEG